MLIVPLNEITPGMKLAANVPHPNDPEQDLLKAGFILEQPVLGKLASLNIDVIYVDYPGLEDLDEILLANLSPERQQVYQQIKTTITNVQRTSKPMVNYADYRAVVRDLICRVMTQGQHPVYIDAISSRLGVEQMSHATAVAQLALTLGINLKRYVIEQRKRLDPAHAADVVNLGVAGMLHDLGKTKLPEHLQHYTSINPPTDPAELDEWQSHPRLTYDMVRGGIEPSAANCCLHHHQRFDGNGFPTVKAKDGKKITFEGTKIHIFARILAAADLYDRLATGPSGKPRRQNAEVFALMRENYTSWIDPQIFSAMTQVIPPFPPGTKVKLSDRSTAVVVGPNPSDPWRPFVRQFQDDGVTLIPDRMNLAEPSAPQIESAGGLNVTSLIPERPIAKKP